MDDDQSDGFVTVAQYMQGRDKIWPPSDQLRGNAVTLLGRVNDLLQEYSSATGIETIRVSSGYRPAEYNATVPGAAIGSAHIECKAVDLSDPGEKIARWIWEHKEFLNQYNLDMEHPDWTPGWVHLDTRHRSGGDNRVFIPRPGPRPRFLYT